MNEREQLGEAAPRCSPSDARDVLLALVRSSHDDVAAEVLRELATPWSLMLRAARRIPHAAAGTLWCDRGSLGERLETMLRPNGWWSHRG